MPKMDGLVADDDISIVFEKFFLCPILHNILRPGFLIDRLPVFIFISI